MKECLFKSICDDRPETVQRIVKVQLKLLNAVNELGQTPIICAAEQKKENTVELLARLKPDIAIQTKNGKRLVDYISNLSNKETILHILDEVTFLEYRFSSYVLYFISHSNEIDSQKVTRRVFCCLLSFYNSSTCTQQETLTPLEHLVSLLIFRQPYMLTMIHNIEPVTATMLHFFYTNIYCIYCFFPGC